jgi:hypothetical protein
MFENIPELINWHSGWVPELGSIGRSTEARTTEGELRRSEE